MGFSVTISSSIVLIGLMVLFTSVSVAVLQGARDLSYATNDYLSRERERLDVKLELQIEFINARNCTFTVRNVGSKAIFFKNQNGFQWNTIVLSYGNSSEWRSYPIERYTVREINVSNTNVSFNPDTHPFINPGEEARIFFEIPDTAPDIPMNGVVTVTFVTHYGVAVTREGRAD